MKTFGELSVKLNELPAEEFGEVAAAAATNGWMRDRSKDDAMKRTGQGVWFTFTLTGHRSLPPAYLFLAQKSPGVLHVPNIISPARDRLSYDDYVGRLEDRVTRARFVRSSAVRSPGREREDYRPPPYSRARLHSGSRDTARRSGCKRLVPVP